MDVAEKRIAVLCHYQLLPERVGGMDYFFWAFDQRCKKEGISVDWFFPNLSKHGGYESISLFAAEHENLELYFINHLSKSGISYSHIFTHFLEICTPFFRDVKKLTTAKMIAVDHNPRPLGGYPLIKQIKKRLKGQLYSQYIDIFVGVSAYTVKAIVKDFGRHLQRKSIVVYNGILTDEVRVREDRANSKPSFLTASHLRHSKGIQDLIAAVSLLPQEIKNEMVIDVYGDGPYRTELETQVKNLTLEKCFHFMGSTSDLKSLYGHYDYMLQPTHMECFSLSILESLAANVPVITTNVGGNEEVITSNENGFIVPAQDVRALSDVLEQVWQGDMVIIGKTQSLIQQRFTIDKMVENYLTLLL